MCLFCDTRLNTIRDVKKEIRELERLVKQHETENAKCTLCKVGKLKHPERRWYHQEHYQKNREAKLAAAKARYHSKKAEATI